jgi:adenylate kinase family enzyme
VLDGYPRDVDQYQGLPEVCRAAGIPSPFVVGVFLTLAQREVRRRIESRRLCANCQAVWSTTSRCCDDPAPRVRADDASPSLVTRRMESYSINEPLLSQRFALNAHKLSVRAVGAPENVARNIAVHILTSMSRAAGVHTFSQRADPPPPRVVE